MFSYIIDLLSVSTGRSLDIASAQGELVALKKRVNTYRSSVDEFHDLWYADAEDLAANLKIVIEMPRVCGRQIGRVNSESITTASQYFKRAITVPMLGKLS